MTDELKIGIPDDEAATAPVQKFSLSKAGARLVANWVFPLVMGTFAFAAHKMLGAGRQYRPAEDSDAQQHHDKPEDAARAPNSKAVPFNGAPEPEAAQPPDGQDGNDDGDAKVVTLSQYRAWRGITRHDGVTLPEVPAVRVIGDVFTFETDDDTTGAPDNRLHGRGPGQRGRIREPDAGDETLGPRSDGPHPGRMRQNHAPAPRGRMRLPRLGSDEAVVLATAMLLAGARDADGDALFVSDISSDSGEVFFDGGDFWVFVPEEGFLGEVKLRITISDGTDAILRTAEMVVTDEGLNEFTGTRGDDQIIASSGDDLVCAGGGGDIVYGGAGDDIIFGGNADDRLFGGDGDDQIFGGNGRDLIHGDDGDDILFGGTGNDRVFGDAGDDVAFGGRGNDIVSGGSGDDVLDGGEGHDTVDGGAGDDRIVQSHTDGGDTFIGGAGTDTIDLARIREDVIVDLGAGLVQIANAPESTVESVENAVCGAGNDTVGSSRDVNVFTGGDGQDRFVFDELDDLENEGRGNDRITDFEVGDRIDLSVLNEKVTGFGLAKLYFAGANAGAFLSAGAVQYYFVQLDSPGEHTVIHGHFGIDTDGEEHEFELELDGHHDLQEGDFILDLHH